MSDFNRMEISRETIFKESVLSLAETRGMEIVAEAGKKRAYDLEQAYKQSAQKADYDTVRSKYALASEKEFATIASHARRELLTFRHGLVEDFFARAEEKLRAFAESAAYGPWLAASLKKHTDMIETGDAVVSLRPADEGRKQDLQALFPTLQFESDGSIALGGLKVRGGRILFDETLDAALHAERMAFYESGKMRLQAVETAPAPGA